MKEPDRIEGFAIVSADGMLADANLVIPEGLIVPADQKFFHDSLAGAALVVHGRHSHEGGPHADGRHRLVVTSRVGSVASNPEHPKSLLWNPKGATLDMAWKELGAPSGLCAVIGGPDVFGLFLDIGYDAFHLTRAPAVRLPGGRPLFPDVARGRTPEEILSSRGLSPGPVRLLDQSASVTLVTWKR
jgi:dihydrofolate reductase